MSTVKTTNLQHPSASDVGITLGADGSVVLPQGFAGGLGTNVVQSVLTARFTTTSGTFTTVTGLSATITPSSATSKVLVIVQISYGLSASALDSAPIFRISGGNATTYVGDASGSRTQAVFGGLVLAGSTLRPHVISGNLVYLDSPGAAVATTYELEVLSGTGTATINGLTGDANADAASRVVGASSITAIEVAA